MSNPNQGLRASRVAGKTPKMPRAMMSPYGTGLSLKPYAPSEAELTFYAKFLFYSVLEPCRGVHINRQPAEAYCKDPALFTEVELRREFLDKISYLCDIEKYGRTTSAAAMQELPLSNFLWVAANEGIGNDVLNFLQWLITQLQEVSAENRKEVENVMLMRAISLGWQRLEFYREKMVKFTAECRRTLKSEALSDETAKLRKWLFKLSIVPSHIQLALQCYNARGKQIEELRRHSKTEGDCCDELAHYIGRLGAHVHAVKIIVTAAMKVPSIRQIREVRPEKESDGKKICVPNELLDPYQIVKTICLSREMHPAETHKYLTAFFMLDLHHNFKALLVEKGGNIVSRVHCELLLVDLFSRKMFRFAGDDKYVGCSKGACYYCFKYINFHNKDFVPPATHNKVFTHVRGPKANPLFDVNGNGEKILRQMEEKMSWAVDQDILRVLDSQRHVVPYQHCSSNGSTAAPSMITQLMRDRIA